MLWPERYQTPRTVWTTSAIAATLLNVGVVWWGVVAWQNQQATDVPAPIKVIAFTEAGEPTPAVAPPATSPVEESSISSATPSAPAFEPVSPAPDGSAPSSTPASTPPVQSENSPTPPQSPANTLPPSSPTPPGEPSAPVAPVNPTPAPKPPTSSPPPSTPSPPASRPPDVTSPQPQPPQPSIPEEENPPLSPTPPGSNSGSGAGLRSTWALAAVPGGSDLPEVLPQMPGGWQAEAATVLSNASCAADLVATGTSQSVTLWPFVEADGTISGFQPWVTADNASNEAAITCLEGLASQLPPLIPATNTGAPIASYAMLLVVNLQRSP